jgi:NAD(P)-dependent dehydrogenase (short-subunit alcohol dehydrogenase family)
MPQNKYYDQKTIVLTGAASGIGRELALQLAAQGARVWALDRDNDGLLDTAGLAQAQGLSILTHSLDVADAQA